DGEIARRQRPTVVVDDVLEDGEPRGAVLIGADVAHPALRPADAALVGRLAARAAVVGGEAGRPDSARVRGTAVVRQRPQRGVDEVLVAGADERARAVGRERVVRGDGVTAEVALRPAV